MKCIVLILGVKIALGKLAQTLFYGAKIVAIKDNFDEAIKLVRKIGKNHHIAIVNSINSYRIEGQKTTAFENSDAIGEVTDYLFMLFGNAENIKHTGKDSKNILN